MSLEIPGIGTVQVSKTEYTSGTVINLYNTYLAELLSVFEKRPGNNAGTLTVDDFNNKVYPAVLALTNLALNGTVDTTSGVSYVSYLPKTLAQRLSVVLQSLTAVGISPSLNSANLTDGQKIELMESWQTLADVGAEAALVNAVNEGQTIAAPTRSLQSMLELEFVKEGNDLLLDELGGLKDALKTVQDLVDTLTTLQNISNQIKVVKDGNSTIPDFNIPTPNPNPDDDDITNYVIEYKQRAYAYFRQLSAVAMVTNDTIKSFLEARAALSAQLPLLEQTSELSRTSTNTLPYFINQVLRDTSSVFNGSGIDIRTVTYQQLQNNPALLTNATEAVRLWITDYQNVRLGATNSNLSGVFQDNLTQCVKGAESLNDTQKEEVKRVMYIFEEFYKSSSALLTSINKIIQGMAQRISR